MTSALSRLLLEAGTAARNFRLPIFRQTAAREAEKLPRIDEKDVGTGKAIAAAGLRQMLRALDRLGESRAREELAESIAHCASALRIEPDRPSIRQEPDYYWIEKEHA